jgi:hypothetical protein
MRRVLVVLVVLVVVAGAFAAGALIFRGDDERNVVESEMTCFNVSTGGQCSARANDEFRALCDEGVDAGKLTVIL